MPLPWQEVFLLRLVYDKWYGLYPLYPVPLSQTYLDAPHAMLPSEFLAILQPGDGGGGVASSCTVEANSAGGWHSQQFHIHTVWPSPVRGPWWQKYSWQHNQYTLAKLAYQHTLKPHPSSVLRLLCFVWTLHAQLSYFQSWAILSIWGRLTGVGTQEVEPSRM